MSFRAAFYITATWRQEFVVLLVGLVTQKKWLTQCLFSKCQNCYLKKRSYWYCLHL